MIEKKPGKILVIGGVTIDKVLLPGNSIPLTAPGGAGLFTALGVQSAGGAVTLLAQRPEPMPALLAPVKKALDWQGPEIPEDQLPRLEIVHFGGGKAELRAAFWGAQLQMNPAALPGDLTGYAYVHIAALGPTQKQLDFAAACRSRGVPRISAGTYGRAAYGETEQVRKLIVRSDVFFMNENEALAIFGSLAGITAAPGQMIFITRAARGAMCVTAEGRLQAPAPVVTEINPTGAGDTFCGAVLSALSLGSSVTEALETGIRLASAGVELPGRFLS